MHISFPVQSIPSGLMWWIWPTISDAGGHPCGLNVADWWWMPAFLHAIRHMFLHEEPSTVHYSCTLSSRFDHVADWWPSLCLSCDVPLRKYIHCILIWPCQSAWCLVYQTLCLCSFLYACVLLVTSITVLLLLCPVYGWPGHPFEFSWCHDSATKLTCNFLINLWNSVHLFVVSFCFEFPPWMKVFSPFLGPNQSCKNWDQDQLDVLISLSRKDKIYSTDAQKHHGDPFIQLPQ